MASLNASSSLASIRPRRARRRAGRPLRRRWKDFLQVSYWKNLPTGNLGKSSLRGGASQQVSGYHVSLGTRSHMPPPPLETHQLMGMPHKDLWMNSRTSQIKKLMVSLSHLPSPQLPLSPTPPPPNAPSPQHPPPRYLKICPLSQAPSLTGSTVGEVDTSLSDFAGVAQ